MNIKRVAPTVGPKRPDQIKIFATDPGVAPVLALAEAVLSHGLLGVNHVERPTKPQILTLAENLTLQDLLNLIDDPKTAEVEILSLEIYGLTQAHSNALLVFAFNHAATPESFKARFEIEEPELAIELPPQIEPADEHLDEIIVRPAPIAPITAQPVATTRPPAKPGWMPGFVYDFLYPTVHVVTVQATAQPAEEPAADPAA